MSGSRGDGGLCELAHIGFCWFRASAGSHKGFRFFVFRVKFGCLFRFCSHAPVFGLDGSSGWWVRFGVTVFSGAIGG